MEFTKVIDLLTRSSQKLAILEQILSKKISNIKKGEPIPMNQFSDLVTQAFGSSNYIKDKEQILICLSLIK